MGSIPVADVIEAYKITGRKPTQRVRDTGSHACAVGVLELTCSDVVSKYQVSMDYRAGFVKGFDGGPKCTVPMCDFCNSQDFLAGVARGNEVWLAVK